jgi:hypothetical protein
LKFDFLKSIIHKLQLFLSVFNVLINCISWVGNVLHSYVLTVLHFRLVMGQLLLFLFKEIFVFVVKYGSLEFFNLLLVDPLLTACVEVHVVELLLE